MLSHVPRFIKDIASSIIKAGGRPLLVGGCVRDILLGLEPKDWDLEVYHLEPHDLLSVLSHFGEILSVGQAFGIWKLKGYNLDISLPRKDNKSGRGHRGFSVTTYPHMSFEEAFRRRDVTINSMGLDLKTETLIDPYNGKRDLEQKVLRATDPKHFSEDPLRGLRVAQLAARFRMTVDPFLVNICSTLNLAELPGERLLGEISKLLLKGVKPSLGFDFLKNSQLILFFPSLDSVIKQGAWDVFLDRIDQAAQKRKEAGPEPFVYMLSIVGHYMPTPEATGVQGIRSFLTQIKVSQQVYAKVSKLVSFLKEGVPFPSLPMRPHLNQQARSLSKNSLTLKLYFLALSTLFPDKKSDIDKWRHEAEKLNIVTNPPVDKVTGEHLLARNIPPGKSYGVILEKCRKLQDMSDLTHPEEILEEVLVHQGKEVD